MTLLLRIARALRGPDARAGLGALALVLAAGACAVGLVWVSWLVAYAFGGSPP